LLLTLQKDRPVREILMLAVQATLESHPNKPAHPDELSRCVEAAFTCVAACTACADACLSERHVEALMACIRTDLDCAAICGATGSVVARAKAGASRQVLESQLAVCIAACRVCSDECRRHAAMHDHCRVCADACDRCVTACNDMLNALRRLV
jgi:hypothetical protein